MKYLSAMRESIYFRDLSEHTSPEDLLHEVLDFIYGDKYLEYCASLVCKHLHDHPDFRIIPPEDAEEFVEKLSPFILAKLRSEQVRQ